MSSQEIAEVRQALLQDSRWAFKALLRLIATVFGFIAMSLFAAAIAYTNENFINTQGNGDWSDGLCLAPIIFSLLYNPIALVMHLLFRKKRPIHPAIRISLDLIVWGLSVPALVFGVLGGIFWYWTDALPSADGTTDCSFFFNAWSQQCSPVAYQIGRLEIAGLVFLFFLFIIHITLFIFACVDLQRKRLAASIEAEVGFDMEYRKDIESRSQSSELARKPDTVGWNNCQCRV